MNRSNDQVILRYNNRGLNDSDTLFTHNQEFLLKNESKKKCIKIEKELRTKLQCGPGGLVRFDRSNRPNPSNRKLRMNPGSLDNPTKNSDPCGPLLNEPVQFDFAKNANVNDLYVTYTIK